MAFRTSFHTGFLVDCGAAEAVRMIRDHGYDAAELNAEALPWARGHVGPGMPAAERAQLAKLGPYSALCAHHADFGQPDAARRLPALDWTLKLIALAPDFGAPVVHVIPGSDAELESLYASLSVALEAAGRAGVELALEPILNQRIGTSAAMLDAIERLPGLKVNFDPSHLQVMERDVAGAAEKLGRHVCHVHMKDATGTPQDFAFVELGRGEIAFDVMLKVLHAQGYAGYLSVEHESHYFGGDTRGPSQVLAESRAFIEDAVRRSGVR